MGWEKRSHHIITCGARSSATTLVTSSLSTVPCAQRDRKKHESIGPGRSDHPGNLWAHSSLAAAPVSCQKPDARCVMTETATRPQSRPLLTMFLAVAYRTASCSSPSPPSETAADPISTPLGLDLGVDVGLGREPNLFTKQERLALRLPRQRVRLRDLANRPTHWHPGAPREAHHRANCAAQGCMVQPIGHLWIPIMLGHALAVVAPCKSARRPASAACVRCTARTHQPAEAAHPGSTCPEPQLRRRC